MTNGVFFVSWELWQQMTFVLAMGIVAVFCAGLVKLWMNNRLMRKQEILDEEKRARYTEMRRSGLQVKRANEIPFGVRAIQSGVQVEGIWISRPATPNEVSAAKLASSTTLESLDPPDNQRRAKYAPPSEDSKGVQVTTTLNVERTAAKHSPSDGSIFQRLTDAESFESTPAGTPPVSKFASQHKKPSHRSPNVLNEDTLRRLEGQAAQSRPTYDTYIPTSAPRNQPRRPSQRSSASSSGESVDSQPTHSARSVSGRSYTSSRSSRLYMARSNMHEHRPGYTAVPQTWTEEREHQDRGPYHGSARLPGGAIAYSRNENPYESTPLPVPEPTFGPGDLHVNRSARRVNNGFEVLPAGTFGLAPPEFGYHNPTASGELGNTAEQQGGYRPTKGANKLKRRDNSQSQ
ncbi:hypothetical protein V8F20_006514 [Naviculisporaceae sp. PSN 640]